MRFDQVADMIESAGIVGTGETEIYFTAQDHPRLIVHGSEQAFYIVKGRRGTKLEGGFNVYHPWSVPDFPKAQVRAECVDAEELIGYLTVHIGDKPVFFTDPGDTVNGLALHGEELEQDEPEGFDG